MSGAINNRNFKGVWIPADVYLSDIPWSAKIIFLEIQSFSAPGESCFMSNTYLSKFIGISTGQVSRHISLLIDKGWITQTAFDGRKRELRSLIEYSFPMSNEESDRKADLRKSAKQNKQNPQGSVREKRKHNNTNTNTSNNTSYSLKNDYSFFVDVWFEVYEKKLTGAGKPAFGDIDGKKIKSILKKIENKIVEFAERTKKTKEEVLTKEMGEQMFRRLLDLAFSDKWLKSNYELSNIDSKFNSIVSKNATNTSDTTAPANNPFLSK